jgi:hypothetical protein
VQKHERASLEAVRAVLEPEGFRVWTETSRAKLHIWAERGDVRAKKTVSSSPADRDTELWHNRRWAERLARGDVRRG